MESTPRYGPPPLPALWSPRLRRASGPSWGRPRSASATVSPGGGHRVGASGSRALRGPGRGAAFPPRPAGSGSRAGLPGHRPHGRERSGDRRCLAGARWAPGAGRDALAGRSLASPRVPRGRMVARCAEASSAAAHGRARARAGGRCLGGERFGPGRAPGGRLWGRATRPGARPRAAHAPACGELGELPCLPSEQRPPSAPAWLPGSGLPEGLLPIPDTRGPHPPPKRLLPAAWPAAPGGKRRNGGRVGAGTTQSLGGSEAAGQARLAAAPGSQPSPTSGVARHTRPGRPGHGRRARKVLRCSNALPW
jgi:hypothetical protein